MSSVAVPKPRLSKRAAILVAVLLLIGTALVVPIRQILAQRGELARLEERVTELRKDRDRLAGEVARMGDPAELERLARQCLGMVKPGEIAIVTVPEDGSAPPVSC